MKTKNANGQVLSEQEMKAVKGGYVITGNDPHNWKYCPQCGHKYGDDELEAVKYDEKTGLYGRFCMECGGFMEEE